MKLKKSFLLIMAICIAFFTNGCKDNNGPSAYTPPTAVLTSFNIKYTEATFVEWENEGAYQNVEFRFNGYDYESWFSNSGEWVVTKIDMPFKSFPEVVQNGFKSSIYASKEIEDTEVIERVNMPVMYVIEIENSSEDMTLYFNEKGEIVKEEDNGINPDPSALPTAISTYITTNYPNSIIIDIDYELSGYIEVDIINDNVVKEVLFSSQNEWVSTKWEVTAAQTPQAVLNVLKAPAYVDYSIDDIYFHQTPQSSDGYYHIELEKPGSLDIFVNIKPNGDIILD